MKKNDEKGTFVWVQHGDKMPFPLDYTAQEVEQKWRIGRNLIRPYIHNSSLFAGFYRWMRYANAIGNEEDKFIHKGIPIELEPFFHRYLDEYVKTDRSSDESALQEFEHELCKMLHREACALEQKTCQEEKRVGSVNGESVNKHDLDFAPNELYWYRRLYENKAFQGAVSLSYWEQEYAYRCELLRELSLQLPLEMQVAQLQKVMASMDTQIAYMLYMINGEQGNKVTNKKNLFLTTFPQELIGKLRDRVVKSNKAAGRAGYRVHDFTIATEVCGKAMEKSLEKYFVDIRSNANTKATRDAVRPYYLQDVCKIPEQSEFQKVCIQLQKYIDTYVDDKKTQEEQERYIIRRCKVYYEPLFILKAVPIGYLQPGYDRSAGAEIVIDELISSLYSDFYVKYSHEISFICNLNRDMEQYCSSINKWAEETEKGGWSRADIVRSCTQRYFNIIRSMCSEHILENPSILESRLSNADIAGLSQTIVEQCKAAYYEFKQPECEWMNEETIRKWWMRYNDICFGTDKTIPLAGTSKEDIQLYTALFFCRVRAECHITQVETSKVYSIFVEHLHKRKGGMHNAPHRKNSPKQAAER